MIKKTKKYFKIEVCQKCKIKTSYFNLKIRETYNTSIIRCTYIIIIHRTSCSYLWITMQSTSTFQTCSYNKCVVVIITVIHNSI
jgi:hypothetical protein